MKKQEKKKGEKDWELEHCLHYLYKKRKLLNKVGVLECGFRQESGAMKGKIDDGCVMDPTLPPFEPHHLPHHYKQCALILLGNHGYHQNPYSHYFSSSL